MVCIIRKPCLASIILGSHRLGDALYGARPTSQHLSPLEDLSASVAPRERPIALPDLVPLTLARAMPALTRTVAPFGLTNLASVHAFTTSRPGRSAHCVSSRIWFSVVCSPVLTRDSSYKVSGFSRIENHVKIGLAVDPWVQNSKNLPMI
jgi:hypothetical protein